MSLLEDNKREKYNLGVTLEKAVSELAVLDPKLVCLKSGVIYNREQDSYILPYLNRRYLVNHSSGEVKPLSAGDKVSLHLQILFLHYLAHADGTPLSGEWITFKELPGGQIYTEPYQKRTIHPFLQYFANKGPLFQELGCSLEATPASFGDFSLVFRPLPRVPLAFVSWDGDEEFPPSANILYDASAAHYLPTEDYALLPGLIIWEMAAMIPRP